MSERSKILLLLGATALVYVGARLWGIADSCLWFDEIFSVHAAEQPWDNLLWFVAQDLVHPPLFYALLRVWISVGGESIPWLRLLPVAFSIIAIVPFVLIGRELKLRATTTCLGLFLLAVNGSLINYTQRVRMYTLLMLLSLVSIWLFTRYFNRGKGLILLCVVNVFLVYTHYFGGLVIASEITAILLFQRIKWRGTIAIFATALIAFFPWLITVISAARSGSELNQNVGWIGRPGLVQLTTFVIDLVEPFYFQFSSDEPSSKFFVSIPFLFVFVVSLSFLAARWRRMERDDGQRIALLAIFAFLPIALAFVISWASPFSVWGTRHLIVCAAPLALLAAESVMSIDNKTVRYGLLIAIFALSATAFVIQINRSKTIYLWCVFDQIGSEFAAASETDKAGVYVFESLIAYHLWFANRNEPNVTISKTDGYLAMPDDEAYFLPKGFSAVKRGAIDSIDGDRIWLVFRTNKPEEETLLLDLLGTKGYMPCPYTPRGYGNTNVFKVEMTKRGEGCSAIP